MKNIIIGVAMWFAACMSAWGMRGVDLRCEYVDNPMCLELAGEGGVRLSWVVDDNGRSGAMQSGYEIEVGSSLENLLNGNADVWSSGMVESSRSANIECPAEITGKSFDKRYWRVRLRDENGRTGEWSVPATWRMGVKNASDWQGARWIALRGDDEWKSRWDARKAKELPGFSQSGPIRSYGELNLWQILDSLDNAYDAAPMFRKEFAAADDLKEAMLYICGLGYFEAMLNGERIGEDVLNPAWTVFDDTALYSAYDMTSLVKKGGRNAIGVTLGRGQLNPICNDAWGLWKTRWVSQPKLIAMLRLVREDGSVEYVVTDETWRVDEGPTVFDDTRLGEVYDARAEQKGWDKPGFDERSWANASVVKWPMESLHAQMLPPVRKYEAVKPVKRIDREEGITLFDIGKNIAGWAKVKVRGPRGARVLVEYCELPSDPELVEHLHPARLKMSSAINDKHWGAFHDATTEVRQQNGYILAGEGDEEFECRFSYKGFQYVRVTADAGVEVIEAEGVPVHSDLRQTGYFSCSDSTVNRLQEMAVRTMLNNFMGIPTDCPHREKQGWTADGYFTAEAAMFNFDMAQFYGKWMRDLRSTQTADGALCTVAPSVGYDEGLSVSWPAAIVYVPAGVYDFYGDRRLLKELYKPMALFAEHARSHERKDSPEMMSEVLGDWVSPADSILPELRGSSILAPPEGVNTYGASSYYSILRHLARISRLLGADADTTLYDNWSERIRGDFNNRFFRPEESAYYGHIPTGYRLAPNAVALMEEIVPADRREDVSRRFLNELAEGGYKAKTGFLGTRAMMKWLPTYDSEAAWRVVTQPEYPGWGYMVEQGATTIWEDWAACASLDHMPYCLVSEYFFRHLAGISLSHDGEGMPQIEIAPQFVSALDHASGRFDSLYGRIESSWVRKGDVVELTVEIPANCTATLRLPDGERTLTSGRHTLNLAASDMK